MSIVYEGDYEQRDIVDGIDITPGVLAEFMRTVGISLGERVAMMLLVEKYLLLKNFEPTREVLEVKAGGFKVCDMRVGDMVLGRTLTHMALTHMEETREQSYYTLTFDGKGYSARGYETAASFELRLMIGAHEGFEI